MLWVLARCIWLRVDSSQAHEPHQALGTIAADFEGDRHASGSVERGFHVLLIYLSHQLQVFRALTDWLVIVAGTAQVQ